MSLREEITKHGSYRKAAQAMGIPKSTLQYRVAQEESGTDTPAIPEGFSVRRLSTYKDGQWTIAEPERENPADALKAMLDEFNSKIDPIKPRDWTGTHLDSDLLSNYILTDTHLGMMAWHEETGADWDLKIAEETINRYFDYAISNTPNSETAILTNLGDYLHFDGHQPVTPTSGHIVDTDSRPQKIYRVALRCFMVGIEKLLTKHKHVHVIHATGNHDIRTAGHLRETFAMLYRNEPRVTVDTSPMDYYAYEWGRVSLFYHHGHKRNMSNVDRAFLGIFRKMWGRTDYSFAALGHRHNEASFSTETMLVKQYRTIAAPDAHSASCGYNSGRSATIPTYSKKYGLYGTVEVPEGILIGAAA